MAATVGRSLGGASSTRDPLPAREPDAPERSGGALTRGAGSDPAGSVPQVSGPVGDPEELLSVLDEAARSVLSALERIDPADRRRPGTRPGQYALDVVADDAVRAVLHRAGLAVFSEESGRTGPSSPLLVVVDPVDGSTNAAIGIPWYSTSLCLLDETGALAALVVHQVTGARYHAIRGQGAFRDTVALRPSGTAELDHAVIGISGFPSTYPGWSQFRALGAASLDICAVAEGILDGYRVAGRSSLSVWDYAAAVLVCTEAGAAVAEHGGRELLVRDASPRRPVVAATAPLLAQLVAAAL